MAAKYAALQDAKGLNAADVTIAALEKSTSQEFAESLIPKAKLVLTGSYDEVIDLLSKGANDVLVADFPELFCDWFERGGELITKYLDRTKR